MSATALGAFLRARSGNVWTDDADRIRREAAAWQHRQVVEQQRRAVLALLAAGGMDIELDTRQQRQA